MENKHAINKAAIAKHLRSLHQSYNPVKREDHQPIIRRTKNNPVIGRRQFSPIDRKSDDVDEGHKKILISEKPFTFASSFGGYETEDSKKCYLDLKQEFVYNCQINRCTPGGIRRYNNINVPDGPNCYSDLPPLDDPVIFSDSDLDLDFFS